MGININSNTVVRIIVRRGSDIERQYATLSQGELGYTIDTKRLFVGDGVNKGGIVVGNVFLGRVTTIGEIAQAQPGDTAFETSTGTLYAFQSDNTWSSIAHSVTVDESLAGVGFNYATSAGTISNIYSATNSVQMNSYFWSLCADRGWGLSTGGGFFFGDVNANTWDVNHARAAFDGPVFVNGASTQIQLSANSGALVNFVNNGGTGNTTFETASAFIFNSTSSTSTSAAPGYLFTGGVNSGAMVVQGNLFVQGSAYFTNPTAMVYATTLSLTSLSADTTGHPALTALMLNNSDTPSHSVILMSVHAGSKPVIYADTSPFVSFNTVYDNNFSSYGFVVSGAALFTDSLTIGGNTNIAGDLSATGDIIAFSTSDANLKDNVTPIVGALGKLLSFRGVEFDWNDKSSYTGHDIGVIAQEVESVLPSAVKTRPDGYKHVNYDKIIPLMIEAIRELKEAK